MYVRELTQLEPGRSTAAWANGALGEERVQDIDVVSREADSGYGSPKAPFNMAAKADCIRR